MSDTGKLPDGTPIPPGGAGLDISDDLVITVWARDDAGERAVIQLHADPTQVRQLAAAFMQRAAAFERRHGGRGPAAH